MSIIKITKITVQTIRHCCQVQPTFVPHSGLNRPAMPFTLACFTCACPSFYRPGNITHNTNDSYIKITYPFHPLFGQFLPLIHETNKPEPAFICRIDDFRQLNVPKWMTEPSAENFSISEIPVINPFSLLESIALVKEYFQFDPPFHSLDQIHNNVHEDAFFSSPRIMKDDIMKRWRKQGRV